MAHQISEDEETLSEVNVIPLADLSLVLLIILMVLSPLAAQCIIQIQAAQAAAAMTQEELAQPESPVIVSFEPGALKLNGAVMGSDLEFVTRLAGVMGRRRDRSVILTASPDLAHGKVVHVMDLIRRHGGQDLVVVKWKEEERDDSLASAGGKSKADRI